METKQKEWVIIFSVISRELLQDNLNRCIRDYDITDIQVWNDSIMWNALIRYIGDVPQIRNRDDIGDEILPAF